MSQPYQAPQIVPVENIAETILDHARATAAPVEAPGAYQGPPAMVVPKGYQIVSVPGWEPVTPYRVNETRVFVSTESFNRYVSDFKTNTTTIFADPESAKALAIIDYHGANAGHCGHRALYLTKHSEDWNRWLGQNKKGIGQQEFALFLEDNLAALEDGSVLLDMINTFSVEGSFSYTKAQRLQDGAVKFAYTVDQKAVVNSVQIPAGFGIRIPVFAEADPIGIWARLRYRLDGGNLKVWYELERLDKAKRDAFELVLQQIAVGTAIKPLLSQLG